MEAFIKEKLLWAAPALGATADSLASRFVQDGMTSMDQLNLLDVSILTSRYEVPFFLAVQIESALKAPGETTQGNTCERGQAAQATRVKFTVDWKKMPVELMKALKAGRRPTESDRLKMVQRIVEDVRARVPHAERKIFVEIAEKIKSTFPNSFDDVFIRSKLKKPLSLTAQLQNCFDNGRRGKKTTLETESPSKNFAAFGCRRWQLASLPENETEETQEVKRMRLYQISESLRRNQWNWDEIAELMSQTFGTLRKDINKLNALIHGLQNVQFPRREPNINPQNNIEDSTIANLTEKWPFLMQFRPNVCHFNYLTEKNVEASFDTFILDFGSPMIEFFCGQKKELDKMRKYKKMYEKNRNETNESSLKLLTVMLMLSTYLNENTDLFLGGVEEGTTVDSFYELYDRRHVPKTPTIFAVGKAYQAKKFYLTIDQSIETVCRSFREAFIMMFNSYFIFGLNYPPKLSLVLDFVQRGVVGINPDQGTKTSTKKNTKRKATVSSRILSLLRKFNIQLQDDAVEVAEEDFNRNIEEQVDDDFDLSGQ